MNIGQAAQHSGLSVKAIRYYEDIGLVSPDRRANGYRDFDAEQIGRLGFLAQARLMGFSLEECRALVALEDDPARRSRDVQALARDNLDAVRRRIDDLRALEARLSALVDKCHGDDTPDCAILDGIGAQASGHDV